VRINLSCNEIIILYIKVVFLVIYDSCLYEQC